MADWDDLRFFLAVARRGSIRGAAQDLGVNHSTVSRRVGALERKLGVRLFERMPGGYFTTPAGEEMRGAAERIEHEVTTADCRVAGRDKRPGGLVRVTLTEALAQNLLMPDLVAFSEAYPGIELELRLTPDMADLSKREADVAIRLSNEPPGHLIGRRLLKYARATYASDDYLARHGSPGELRWIGWNDVVPDPQWGRESDYPKVPIRHRIHHSTGQLEAAKAGMGLTMLPCFMGDAEPTLRRLPPGTATPDRDIWLLTHEDLRNTARVRTFLAFMADAILRHRDLIEGRLPRE